jgi:threonylcarbamoyladenosine tRNA methylthiotransferase MtaB
VAQVMDQITQLGRLGYHEVVLTGIHLGCYGQDLVPATGLYDLLCRIQESGAIHRVRISSIEPGELSEKIIHLATTDKSVPGKLCPHFHLPLQSGDDTILKRMHRPYHRETFRELVFKIIDRLPDAAIGVDTLIGFPGETASAFENTYSLIQDLPVAYLHVFPFSAREGPPAFSFSDQVHPPVIKQRSGNMRRLGADKRSEFYSRSLGKTVTVLVETTRNNIDGRLRGLTDNYLPVRFHGPDHLFNTFQRIDIHRLLTDGVPEGVIEVPSPMTPSGCS